MKNKAKSFLEAYKKFAIKGNLIDLAIGVIIGAAFTKIVNSLVNDIVMPCISFLTGGINFKDLKYIIRPAVDGVSNETAILYGSFIQVVIEFLIISLAVFFIFRFVVRLREKMSRQETAAPAPVAPAKEVLLLEEIRDILKAK